MEDAYYTMWCQESHQHLTDGHPVHTLLWRGVTSQRYIFPEGTQQRTEFSLLIVIQIKSILNSSGRFLGCISWAMHGVDAVVSFPPHRGYCVKLKQKLD